MALLDVSDVLLDPDFMDHGLVCERNTQTVDSAGMAQTSTRTIRFAGVVTSNSGDSLERMSFGERITGSILIHTKFVLLEGTDGQTADIVTWQGKRYTVSKVNSYKHFGGGFVSAECDLIPLAG